MKKILTLGFLLLAFGSWSQKASEIVTRKSCDCLDQNTDSVRNYDEFITLITTCVSPYMMEYSKELKKEFGFTESDPSLLMELIGKRIGEELVYSCPQFSKLTLGLMQTDDQMKELTQEAIDNNFNSKLQQAEAGTILSVATSFPCELSVKTEDGETLNFLWLDAIAMEEQYLQSPGKLKGKKIQFVYEVRDLYDPSKSKYIPRKILKELTIR